MRSVQNSVRSFSIVCATLLVVVLTLGIAGWPQVASSAPKTPSAGLGPTDAETHTIAAGVVTNDGNPTEGIQIDIFADPAIRGNESGRVLPLGSTTTDADGTYAITTDFDAIPRSHVKSDGGVDLTLILSRANRSITWTYTLYPTDKADAGLHVVIDGSVSAARSHSASSGTIAPLFTTDFADKTFTEDTNHPSTFVTKTGKKYGPARVARTSRVGTVKRLSAMHSYVRAFLKATPAEQARMLRPMPVGQAAAREECGTTSWGASFKRDLKQAFMPAYSAAGIPVHMKQGVGGDTKHTMGIAVAKSGGGFEASGSTSESYDKSAGQDNVINALAYNRVNYRVKHVMCFPNRWEQYNMYSWFSDFQQVAHVNVGSYCATKYAGGYFQTGETSSATIGGGVSFPGISLNSQSGFSTSQDLYFDFTRQGKICGNNANGPNQSSRLDAR